MKSWMTSVGGIMAAAGTAMQASNDSTVKTIGIVVGVIGTAMLGLAAKDFNVTGGSR